MTALLIFAGVMVACAVVLGVALCVAAGRADERERAYWRDRFGGE